MPQTPVKVAIIAAMALGSLAMWIATPLGWIYLVSRLSSSSQVQMWHIFTVLVGIPLTMVVIGKVLGGLNDVYGRVTDTTPTVRVTPPWRRSLRGERGEGHPRTVLDVVMVVSVSLALLAMAVWFIFFASGGGLPSA